MNNRRRLEIEDEALIEPEGPSKLTSDLPSREGRRGRRPRFILPFAIIFVAGFLGFLIPTLANKPGLSQTAGQNTESELQELIDQQRQAQTEPVPQPQPQLVNKTFALVTPNDVGYLNVRTEPSTASARLGTLDIGDKVEVLGEQTGWVKVSLAEPLGGANEGWVSAEYVQKVTEQVPAE